MVFCPEHPKRDQIMEFTPLSETTSIPASFIWEFPPPPPPPPPPRQRKDRTQCHHFGVPSFLFVRMLFFQQPLAQTYTFSGCLRKIIENAGTWTESWVNISLI